MSRHTQSTLAVAVLLVLAVACGKSESESPPHDHKGHEHTEHEKGGDPFASLSAEDAKLARAQAVCPVSDEKLGSMGAPVKVMVKDKAVFICCASCRKMLEREPERYLAKLK